jgi:hypothetical protein
MYVSIDGFRALRPECSIGARPRRDARRGSGDVSEVSKLLFTRILTVASRLARFYDTGMEGLHLQDHGW